MIIDKFEPGEVWMTSCGIRFEIVSIEGQILNVKELPHKSMRGVKEVLTPRDREYRAVDFARTVIANVTEIAA